MASTFYPDFFDTLSERLRDASSEDLELLSSMLLSAPRGKVIVAGNGGSAATASHVAVDLTKAAGVRSVTFNESDLITCFGNDYGYEHWLARAVEFYGDPADVLVLISSSGRSPNILNAAAKASDLGMKVVTLSGFDAANPLRSAGDLNLWVDSHSYNIVETVHQAWLVAAVDHIAAGRAAAASGA